MSKREIALVTGGSGYFGTTLVKRLILENYAVRVLDLNYPNNPEPSVEYIAGDVCNLDACIKATAGVKVVFHNVAQVPLANDSKKFNEVNIDGTRNICEASKRNGVKNFVYTSSSAVYGIPYKLPVMKEDPKIPVEDYGRAKLEGELICKNLTNYGIQVKIIRPRTILGLGRLGIFGILFGWVSRGINIYTLGKGDGPYQFIHSEDLAEGVLRASKLNGDFEFNLGALEYGTFKEDLQKLCDFANTGSRVIGLSDWFVRPLLKMLSYVKFLPFASYQLKLYSKPMYFQSEEDWKQLGYTPKYSNSEMLIESYSHYLQSINPNVNVGVSHHQKTPKGISLSAIGLVLKPISKIQNIRTSKPT
jgi:nucleoside-diphosphate-sugar epimerase